MTDELHYQAHELVPTGLIQRLLVEDIQRGEVSLLQEFQ